MSVIMEKKKGGEIMPFEIVRNDLVNMSVDAIVNTTNPEPVIGYGVDSGIHQKAGPELLEARRRIGKIPVGSAAITPGYSLPARYVIHTVCPVWQGGRQGEAELLRRCYDCCLEMALRRRCKSIAFPLMSAGNHGFPKPLAIRIAMDAIRDFLMEQEMHITLVVFSRDAWQLSEKLFSGLTSFIDEHYVQQKNYAQYGVADKCEVRYNQQETILREQLRQRREEALRRAEAVEPGDGAEDIPDFCLPRMEAVEDACEYTPAPKASGRSYQPRRTTERSLSLEEMLKKTDAGFSETLLRLIDASGKKDSEVYSRANVSRQHFSKIRNNPGYKPTKATAIAFAIALELNLEETKDLIGRAGYALTYSSKFDVIIMYFIQERNYDLYDINTVLFQYDQSLLGA